MDFSDVISINIRINIPYNLTGQLERSIIKHYQYDFHFIICKKLAEYRHSNL